MFVLPQITVHSFQKNMPEGLQLDNPPGLTWIGNLLTPIQQERLIKQINNRPLNWQCPLYLPSHHSIKCYGWQEKPTYDLSILNPRLDYLGEIPFYLQSLSNLISLWMGTVNQIVIHRINSVCALTCPIDRVQYTIEPGWHHDHSSNFGSTTALVALSKLTIQFRRGMLSPISLDLDSGEAIIMKDECRYKWQRRFILPPEESQLFLILRNVIV